MGHQRLLLLSCSQRKRSDPGPLPAIERYDGPFFRVLRRYQRGFSITTPQSKPLPDIYILSAEYGLISADQPIADYERRMTAPRADELRPTVLAELRNLLGPNTSYQELFLCMGREYRRTLDSLEMFWPKGLTVAEAGGSMGGKQAQLYDWLHGAPPKMSTYLRSDGARICGIKIDFTPQQVLEVARLALESDGKGAADYRMWYVLVDNRRVSPKWLVNQLTGCPVNRFHSDSARHVLTQLGIEIHRVNDVLGEEDL